MMSQFPHRPKGNYGYTSSSAPTSQSFPVFTLSTILLIATSCFLAQPAGASTQPRSHPYILRPALPPIIIPPELEVHNGHSSPLELGGIMVDAETDTCGSGVCPFLMGNSGDRLSCCRVEYPEVCAEKCCPGAEGFGCTVYETCGYSPEGSFVGCCPIGTECTTIQPCKSYNDPVCQSLTPFPSSSNQNLDENQDNQSTEGCCPPQAPHCELLIDNPARQLQIYACMEQPLSRDVEEHVETLGPAPSVAQTSQEPTSTATGIETGTEGQGGNNSVTKTTADQPIQTGMGTSGENGDETASQGESPSEAGNDTENPEETGTPIEEQSDQSGGPSVIGATGLSIVGGIVLAFLSFLYF